MDFTKAIQDQNHNQNGQPLEGLAGFDFIEPAPAFEPLPPGIYRAHVVSGEFVTTRSGTDAYKIRFEIIEGPQQGRTVTRLWTFGAKALPYSKRDLAAFGLSTSSQLLSPFPAPGQEIHCKITVALRREDDGTMWNDIKKIDGVQISASPLSEFMLPAQGPAASEGAGERGEGGPNGQPSF